jgi:hypothetical protein
MNKILSNIEEEKIIIELKRPDKYTLYPTKSIFVDNFSGIKENFCIGDRINIVGFMPLQIEKSELGQQTIIELYSNLSDTIHKIIFKNQFGIITSYLIQ